MKDVLLTIAGVVGGLSILWFVVAAVFGLSIVVVLTGSMAPGLPTGSALIVEDDVAAAEVVVGDVVTVPRPNQPLPVTHRVIGIDPVEGDSSSRSLTLQGDDNDTPDREPYVVATVQRSIVGLPGVGFVIRAVQTPLMIGAATLLIGLLAVWAFWPQTTDARSSDEPRRTRQPRRQARRRLPTTARKHQESA